ncbi:MAG: nitroreductase/quinone reductase family protein [Chloroflexota bacterium]|nr:nitroreductase/quinone reductase family protein [Chloroflexota bacterium]
MRLFTRGRRTGREHAVSLWFAHQDGTLWLRADERGGRGPDWYRNLQNDHSCEVEVDGHRLRGHLDGDVERDAALRRLVTLWREKYGALWVSDWYIDSGRLPVKIILEA